MKREMLGKKNEMKKMFYLNSGAKIRKYDIIFQNKSQEDSRNLLAKIHIDSEDFDPYVLLITLHDGKKTYDLEQACNKLRSATNSNAKVFQSLIY